MLCFLLQIVHLVHTVQLDFLTIKGNVEPVESQGHVASLGKNTLDIVIPYPFAVKALRNGVYSNVDKRLDAINQANTVSWPWIVFLLGSFSVGENASPH